MPELPDVERFRALLAEHATGHRVEHVDVADAGVLRGITARQLDDGLRGNRFARPDRHGKWLIAHTAGPAVLLHFGMTGSLQWLDSGAPPDRHDRVIFVISGGGELRYRDMRKLQGIALARNRCEEDRVLAGLGPDALDVTPQELDHTLSGRRGAIKATLINQQVIAGLGNLLADEILWRARIHPRRPARCRTPLCRSRIGGRTTFWCPRCQGG